MEDRRNHGDVIEVPRTDPRIIRHQHVAGPQGLDRIFAKYRKVDVVEINDEGLYGYGQLASLLRSALAIPTIRSICKTDGLTFKVQEILAGVSRLDASAKR